MIWSQSGLSGEETPLQQAVREAAAIAALFKFGLLVAEDLGALLAATCVICSVPEAEIIQIDRRSVPEWGGRFWSRRAFHEIAAAWH